MNNFTSMRYIEHNSQIINGMLVSQATLLGSIGIFEMPTQKKKAISVWEKIKNEFANISCKSKKVKRYALARSKPNDELHRRQNVYRDHGYYCRKVPYLLDYLFNNRKNAVYATMEKGRYTEYTGEQVLTGLKELYLDETNSKYVRDKFTFDNDTYALREWGFSGRGSHPDKENFFNTMKRSIGDVCCLNDLDNWLIEQRIDDSGTLIAALKDLALADSRVKDLLHSVHKQICMKTMAPSEIEQLRHQLTCVAFSDNLRSLCLEEHSRMGSKKGLPA